MKVKVAKKGSSWTRIAVLVILTVQTSVFHLVLRISRSGGAAPYSALAAVCYTELIKFVASCVVLSIQEGDPVTAMNKLVRETRENRRTLRLLIVPAVLYAVQNTMVIHAISYLSAAEFSVARQIKVPVTGVFSVLLLKKELGLRKWVALIMVASGVAIVQLAKTRMDGYKKLFFHGPSEDWWDHSVGILFALGSCITSGLAAVWFEMLLKSSQSNLWIVNIQLAAMSASLATVGVLATAGVGAFLKSFDRLALLAVTFSASDGLVIALVMKYADAILKGFATSVAICITAIISVLMGDQESSRQLAVGCGIVASSVMMYAYSPANVAQIQRRLSRLSVAPLSPSRVEHLMSDNPTAADEFPPRPASRTAALRTVSSPRH
eukprot:m.16700 g.16700  ORF g.16700 m.16700 type:complete len:380 (+) comp3414_c0_seq1:461-1600(+)